MKRVIAGIVGVVALGAALDALLTGFDFWDGVLEHPHLFTRDVALPLDLTAEGSIPLSDVRSHTLLSTVSALVVGSFGAGSLYRAFKRS